jgi:hypothetical protein
MIGFFVLVLVVVLVLDLWRRDASSTFGQGERNVQRSRPKSSTRTRTTTRTIGNRSPARRYADTPGFVAPKWAKDFSLGRSPRDPRKSHQALKAFQKKLRAAAERGRKLAFLRPYRAGRILDAFPGASPQAFVFRPFQGVRSPTEERAFRPRARPRPRFLNVGMASLSRTGAKPGPGTRQLYEMIETLHGPKSRTRTRTRTRTI